MPRHPKLLSKNEQRTKLGDALKWHPLFLLTTIGILLEAIFLFVAYYEFCLERLVWYESLLVLLYTLSVESLLNPPCWESQKLCYACSYASLKFLEPWICSSASLISFWARCALFLKKCYHASLRFIWELVNFRRNSLLLHLYYFERWKNLCSCSSLRFVWAIKSNIWN